MTLYIHKKSGNLYHVLFEAFIEKTMEEVVVYEPVAKINPTRWVRPKTEFFDGQFERYVAPPPSEGQRFPTD